MVGKEGMAACSERDEGLGWEEGPAVDGRGRRDEQALLVGERDGVGRDLLQGGGVGQEGGSGTDGGTLIRLEHLRQVTDGWGIGPRQERRGAKILGAVETGSEGAVDWTEREDGHGVHVEAASDGGDRVVR